MKWRVDLKRLLIFIAIISIIVLVIRGCMYAGNPAKDDYDDYDYEGYEPYYEAGETPSVEPKVNISVYIHKEKKVVDMDLDEYIIGVVSAEMPSSFENEAIMAQAVAARTFAVRHLTAYNGVPCSAKSEICTDSTCCQAWRSAKQLQENWGNNFEKNFAKIKNAVLATSGEVAVYDGEPIEALYHSTSGGYTEDAQNVFSESIPYLVGVASPGENKASHFTTSKNFTIANFVKKFNAAYPKAKLAQKNLKDQIKILSRYDSGRVETIQVGKVKLTGREFRTVLVLDSTNFKLNFSGNKVTVQTTGFGHGVGMSQYGANAMAEQGSNYQSILEHYYTGITITKLSKLV